MRVWYSNVLPLLQYDLQYGEFSSVRLRASTDDNVLKFSSFVDQPQGNKQEKQAAAIENDKAQGGLAEERVG